ncbi:MULTISPECIES: RNA 2',3'-cyclic phosphodiesterase [Pontibacillus]|uniref:RNA 2',3'-cyclic phosphodiesterase n=1 Tax=Pontibacillus chungwhensis TaxID=265426 RepID=A0ABY8UWA0_9BACI|nr:RNA 2',3'-cyclic phosphodiesterase [Pontibacillus chungwhensis]MCD5323917.1 RNA 2',3'-cyclic phosphodiesterase [Pontibacillus sp. HN14]WIF97272.1 RNA 2',3'-cyclic phosphodiesterase [Pontibacillus chungwhensis]
MAETHYFIGISLSVPAQQTLAQLQNNLSQDVSYKQWTNPKDLHITLTFLGGVKPGKVEEIQQRMRKVARSHSPFPILLKGIGTFGKENQPRVLWVGAEKTNSLTALHREVQDQCAEAGFKKDNRSYTPHITLAKKWNNPQKFLSSIPEAMIGEEEFVHSFSLFRIHPDQQPKYERVEHFKLGEEA